MFAIKTNLADCRFLNFFHKSFAKIVGGFTGFGYFSRLPMPNYSFKNISPHHPGHLGLKAGLFFLQFHDVFNLGF